MSGAALELVCALVGDPTLGTSCQPFHEGLSCNHKALQQFVTGSRSVAKMYLMVHMVPFLLFKRKKLRQNPAKELLKLLLAFIKSLLFAGGYTALVRRVVCLVSRHHGFHGYSNGIAAVAAGVSLNFEPVTRQSEIALFCLNKSMEVMYQMARRRNWPVRIAHGECLLVAAALAVIVFHYLDCPEAIRESYRSILDRLLKDC